MRTMALLAISALLLVGCGSEDPWADLPEDDPLRSTQGEPTALETERETGAPQLEVETEAVPIILETLNELPPEELAQLCEAWRSEEPIGGAGNVGTPGEWDLLAAWNSQFGDTALELDIFRVIATMEAACN
jgi:hypothetical protein